MFELLRNSPLIEPSFGKKRRDLEGMIAACCPLPEGFEKRDEVQYLMSLNGLLLPMPSANRVGTDMPEPYIDSFEKCVRETYHSAGGSTMQKLIDFLSSMLQTDPAKRASPEALLKHAWLLDELSDEMRIE